MVKCINTAPRQNAEIDTSTKKRVPTGKIFLGATVAGTLFNTATVPLAKRATYSDCKELRRFISPEIIDKTMDLAEIKKLGVKLSHIDTGNACEIGKEIKKQAKNLKNMNLKEKFSFHLKKFFINAYRKSSLDIPSGKNAIYFSHTNTINLNVKKGGAFIFHELGHAQNFKSNNSIMKFITKMRNPIISSAIITAGLACAFIPRAEGEKADTFIGKTQNFLKNSCVGITAVGALATPLEEGIASLRGAKIAKQVLSKEQLKKINIMNTKALLAYCAVATGSILTTYFASKLCDKFRNENENKDNKTSIKNGLDYNS